MLSGKSFPPRTNCDIVPAKPVCSFVLWFLLWNASLVFQICRTRWKISKKLLPLWSKPYGICRCLFSLFYIVHEPTNPPTLTSWTLSSHHVCWLLIKIYWWRLCSAWFLDAFPWCSFRWRKQLSDNREAFSILLSVGFGTSMMHWAKLRMRPKETSALLCGILLSIAETLR